MSFKKAPGFVLGLFVISGALLSSCSETKERPTSDFQKEIIPWAGQNRVAFIHAPPAKPKHPGYTVILAFHGGTGTALSFDRITNLSALADKESFMVVFPEGIDRKWDDGRPERHTGYDDVGFVSQLIDRLVKKYNANPGRIFATGISNGGLFTFRLACELSDKIEGIAPVASNMVKELSMKCTPKKSISILNIVGDKDPLVPFIGGQITGPLAIRKLGEVLSSDATIAYWKDKGQCRSFPAAADLPPITDDDTTIRKEIHGECAWGSSIVRYIVKNGGHTWPGGVQYAKESLIGKTTQNLDANKEIWTFFSQIAQ